MVLFTGARAPSTLGTFLRTFTFGHVRQLDAVAARFLTALARNAPILPGAGRACYLDIEDTVKATHGYAKQGAWYGYTGVKGLNALLAIISTPTSAPVIAATRLRRGGTNSARGAAKFVSDALVTAMACGGRGLVTVRADSAHFGHDVIAAARRGWCPVLDHRPDELHCPDSDLVHQRVGMDPDPLPERDLGRRRTTPGLRAEVAFLQARDHRPSGRGAGDRYTMWMVETSDGST